MSDGDHFVREDVRKFLQMLEQVDGPEMDEMSLDHARAAYNSMRVLTEREALPLEVIHDLTCPGPGGDIPLRLYDKRASRGAGPVVMFFHGGGFVIGDLDTHDAFCTELAHGLDLPVVAVHYRRAPEAPFPAAPDDCEAAARWVAGNPAELGFPVTGLVTTGDSAGGNLTIVVTQALTDEPAGVPVLVQAPIYPVCGPIEHTESYEAFGNGFSLTKRSMAFFTQAYQGDTTSKRNHPVLHDAHHETPPTVLMTAGLDPLRDSGREYAAHLIENGVDVTYLEAKGTIHGFVNTRKALPSGQKDVETLIDAIRLMLERHS